MKSRDFEAYAKNQLVINLSILSIVVSCTISILVVL